MDSTNAIVIIAIVGVFGNTLAVVVAALFNQRAARQAQRAASAAQLATEKLKADAALAQTKALETAAKAQQDAALAQAAAGEAAKALVQEAATTAIRLAEIKAVGDSTHSIVNNRKTVMLQRIADLAKRVARDNPDDAEAQAHARVAQEEANQAQLLGGVPAP